MKDKLKVLAKKALKSKLFWKTFGTLVVSTGLLSATDLVDLSSALKVVTDGLALVS